MNDHFVCIKIDREEPPDIDHIYMSAVQLLTGRGGWPQLHRLARMDANLGVGTYSRREIGFRHLMLLPLLHQKSNGEDG